jgi:hypothetical protein
MHEKILERMKRGVYYPGHQLGPRAELDRLVAQGYLERMDASFFCGPDSEPTYCRAAPKPPPTRHAPTDETDR